MPETSISLLERLNDREDAEAWRRMLDLYTPLIRGWIGRQGVAPADADDLVQDVLEAVVRDLPRFRHNHRCGAFRKWLRLITVNRLRRAWRAQRIGTRAGDFGRGLDELEDPDSVLSRLWDREHDRHVVRNLLAWIEPEFRRSTYEAFRAQVIEGKPAGEVAAGLGMTVNAVLVAKSKVLKRLRESARGLVD